MVKNTQINWLFPGLFRWISLINLRFLAIPFEKTFQLFLIETRRLTGSLEGLNSSLALAAGELLPEMWQPRLRSSRALKVKEPRLV